MQFVTKKSKQTRTHIIITIYSLLLMVGMARERVNNIELSDIENMTDVYHSRVAD